MIETIQEEKPLNTGHQDRKLFIWVFLIYLGAMGLRFIRASAIPFSAGEAELAFKALQVARGTGLGTGSIPAYLGLTSLIFYITSATTFWAHFWPAVIGGSLALIPFFWRDKLKPSSVALFSLVFALDPLFFVSSRLIISPIFALAGIVWAITLLRRRHPILGGVFLAVGFLGGSWFWIAVLAFIVSMVILRIIKGKDQKLEYPGIDNSMVNKNFVVKFFAGFLLTLFLLSTSFLLNPSGISGIGQGIVGIFNLFSMTFGHPFWFTLLVGIAYSYIAIILGWVGGFKLANDKNRSPLSQFFSILVIVGLVFSVIFSRTEFGSLVFFVLPLWCLAILWLDKEEQHIAVKNPAFVISALFTIVMLIFLGLTVSALARVDWANPQAFQYFLTILAAILVLTFAMVLISLGWSKSLALRGFTMAIFFVLAINTIGLTTRAMGGQVENVSLLFSSGSLVFPTSEPSSVLSEFTRLGKLEPQNDRAIVMGSEIEGADWLFREFNQQPLLAISVTNPDPKVVLSKNEEKPLVDSAYRGMKVVSKREINWNTLSTTDYLKFVIGKPLPSAQQEALLWVREDLFVGVGQ